MSGEAVEQAEFIPDPQRWRILSVLLVTIFMSLVGVSIVNVALPSIEVGLDASQGDLQWILSGYALTFGVVLVPAGRAGDLLGRGPLFIAGVILFTLSSVAAGLAPDPLSLNIARLLQGVGSGLLNPQAVGMIQQYFRGPERGRAFGAFGSVVGVSVAIGPVLGGLLIQAGGVENGWRWTFFVNLPVGIVAVVLALLWFPRPMLVRNTEQGRAARAVGPEGRPKRPDLDPVGALLLGIAVLGILLPFMEAGSEPLAWALLPVGIGLVALWAGWERRYKQRGRSPMVDLGIFRTPSFSNGTVLISLYFLGITSIWILVALYMQDGLGYSALASGLVGLPSATLAAFSANWAGRAVNRIGRKVVIGGMYCALAGLALSIAVVLGQEAGVVSEWWLLLTLGLVGAGQGAVVSPNQTLTLADVPLQYAGSSGGILQTGQRIGTSVGIAMITALAFGVLARSNWTVAICVGFAGISVVVAASLLVAYKDQRQRQPGTSSGT